jgi:hypothetical protein
MMSVRAIHAGDTVRCNADRQDAHAVLHRERGRVLEVDRRKGRASVEFLNVDRSRDPCPNAGPGRRLRVNVPLFMLEVPDGDDWVPVVTDDI